VPDFYQGTEIWDFSLVDPDNRRPVDYTRRQALLQEIDDAGDRSALVSRLMGAIRDDRLKLYTTTTMLRYRRDHRTLFESGGYVPLSCEGAHRDHLFGFARRHGREEALVIVPRLVATLMPGADAPLGERAWGDTRIRLDESEDGVRPRYRNVFTGRCAAVHQQDGRAFLRAAEVFEHFPVALLT
jgi:(1->4)-alpha-D-glucan 1-alpha-D-glucosylmutase